jgi:hypothetical protein
MHHLAKLTWNKYAIARVAFRSSLTAMSTFQFNMATCSADAGAGNVVLLGASDGVPVFFSERAPVTRGMGGESLRRTAGGAEANPTHMDAPDEDEWLFCL